MAGVITLPHKLTNQNTDYFNLTLFPNLTSQIW